MTVFPRKVSALACVLVFAFIGPTWGQPSPPTGSKDPFRVSSDGEPLPTGAIARLGSTRLQHAPNGHARVALSPDGKTLATMYLRTLPKPGEEVFFWSTDTGEKLAHAPVGVAQGLVFAPDST